MLWLYNQQASHQKCMQDNALGTGNIKCAYKGKGGQHPAGIADCYIHDTVCVYVTYNTHRGQI